MPQPSYIQVVESKTQENFLKEASQDAQKSWGEQAQVPAGRRAPKREVLNPHFPPLPGLTMDGHLVAPAGLAQLIAHHTFKLG